MSRLWILSVLGLIAVLGIACSDEGEDVPAATVTVAPASGTSASEVAPSPVQSKQSTVTPVPEGTLWRWVNITLLIPPDSDVTVLTERLRHYSDKASDSDQAITLIRDVSPDDTKASGVVIDAQTGVIVSDQVLDEDREAMNRILATISVEEFNRSSASWPYNGETPSDAVRETVGSFSFVRPAPSTGLQVYSALADPGGEIIGIKNGHSTLTINYEESSKTFKVYSEGVSAEDKDVFDRWASTVLQCGLDVTC